MTVYMIQTSRNRWKIQSESGNVILDDVMLSNKTEAEEYIKCYVSTWTWDYRLVLLEDQ
jgi:hypothetical protein